MENWGKGEREKMEHTARLNPTNGGKNIGNITHTQSQARKSDHCGKGGIDEAVAGDEK